MIRSRTSFYEFTSRRHIEMNRIVMAVVKQFEAWAHFIIWISLGSVLFFVVTACQYLY